MVLKRVPWFNSCSPHSLRSLERFHLRTAAHSPNSIHSPDNTLGNSSSISLLLSASSTHPLPPFFVLFSHSLCKCCMVLQAALCIFFCKLDILLLLASACHSLRDAGENKTEQKGQQVA